MGRKRKNGEGTVRLRKDGRWEGRVVIGYNDKGRPKTKNVLAKTKSECIAKLKVLRDSIKVPTHDRPKPGSPLGDWMDYWYQNCKKPNFRPNTQMSYERRIYQHIIPSLGSIPLDRLTTNDIQQFYAKLKQVGRLIRAEYYGEGLSDQTVRGIHTTLHAALDKAVAEKLLFRNPADGCRLPPARAREMQVLTPEEIQRLLIQAKEDGCFELLLLELSTGLRRGELCALQWSDLNFRTGELRVERQVHRARGELLVSPPKTKASNRSVILPFPVLNALKKYKETVTSQWMFPSPINEDSPRDPNTVRKRLRTILEKAGCKKIRFHDLRHTFSIASLEHGMDIKTLSTIIGHVSSSTTLNVYAHITDEMRRTAAIKIDRGIGKAEPQTTADTTPKKPSPSTFQAQKGQRRKAGTGCVSQINEKLWEGRYSPIWPDGKKHACNDKLKLLKDSIKAPASDPLKSDSPLGDWLDHWYQNFKKPHLRPNTQMSYERRIYQHIIPSLGTIPLDKLTTNDIQQFYTRLKQDGRLIRAEVYGEGLSDQTVRGIHTTLHTALDKAVADKLLFRNPADGCRLPPARAREMQVLTPEEIQRLLIQAKEDGCFEMLLLELSTGLRRGEICALQWSDLNFRTGELRVERQVHRARGELLVSPPKTKASNRSIILPALVLNILEKYKDTVDSKWLFPSPINEDSPRDPDTVRKRLRTILERAGCKKIRFHDLRHTFSTASLEHGMDVKTLSTIIGHVSSSTTLNVYAHITDEMRRTAAIKIDRGIGKAEPQTEADTAPRKPSPSTFQAHKGQRRKAGTGCVSQINEKLWEGRYSPIWPDGKKHACNVYAHSEEECEKLLAELIARTKAEIRAEKERLKTDAKAG